MARFLQMLAVAVGQTVLVFGSAGIGIYRGHSIPDQFKAFIWLGLPFLAGVFLYYFILSRSSWLSSRRWRRLKFGACAFMVSLFPCYLGLLFTIWKYGE
jgi:hypothetical protein